MLKMTEKQIVPIKVFTPKAPATIKDVDSQNVRHPTVITETHSEHGIEPYGMREPQQPGGWLRWSQPPSIYWINQVYSVGLILPSSYDEDTSKHICFCHGRFSKFNSILSLWMLYQLSYVWVRWGLRNLIASKAREKQIIIQNVFFLHSINIRSRFFIHHSWLCCLNTWRVSHLLHRSSSQSLYTPDVDKKSNSETNYNSKSNIYSIVCIELILLTKIYIFCCSINFCIVQVFS